MQLISLVTVRSPRLADVSMTVGGRTEPVPDADLRLVNVADQTPDSAYPRTAPRGGIGRAIFVP